jgi:hypothetical protein
MTPPERKQLVVDFFFAFSRAEYALKVTGYKKKGGNGDDAQADWTSFAKDVAKLLPTGSDQELTVAKEYLLNPNSAPKKQWINNGSLEWKPVSPTCQINNPTDEEKESDILLLYVRRIRNNLFHGGKSSITESPERNETLLKKGLIVLLACINSIETVRDAYCDSCDAFVQYPSLPFPPP